MYVSRPDSGIGWLADREALAVWLGRSRETIKKRVPVVGHLPDGTALCNMEQAHLILQDIPTRQRRPRPRGDEAVAVAGDPGVVGA
jgi:hypothetical protein